MMLAATDVVAAYPGGDAVLTGAHVAIRDGARLALLGANGSGKTTLLRCLSGAHRPSAGTVLRDGIALRHDRAGLHRHRRHVQLVLQDPDDQLFSADVTQDVAFGPLNLGLDEATVRARVAEALELLGAAHLADRATHQLSYGERKRVSVAGAMAMQPDVLLLDEPTAGLDPAGVAEMRVALERLSALGTALVVATHDVAFALEWADEAAVVCHGRVDQGPVTAVLSDAALLADAHLAAPWPLALASGLGWTALPRNLAEVLALLTSGRTTG
ncbi:MAG: ATP-binding cassette domain-containing protein [Propionibacteriaceae bacterium]|nr:ATP-binding cassette domain-containing protein [Propionibacteriaceae bacterium]